MPWHSDFTHIRDVGLYTDIFPLKMPLSNAGRHFFKSYPDLSWFRYIIGSPIVNPGQDKSRVSLQRLPSLPHEIRNRCSSVLLRSAGGTIFLCRIEDLNRTWKIIVATDAAGGTTFFAATKNGVGRGRSSSQQTLQAGHFLSRQRRMESDAEDCRRNRRCRRAILLCSNKN